MKALLQTIFNPIIDKQPNLLGTCQNNLSILANFLYFIWDAKKISRRADGFAS